MPKAMHEVHVGEVYGLLTVREVGLRAERTPGQIASRAVGERAAMCSCACGSQRLVKVGYLARGVVTSCGCKPQPKRSTTVLDTAEILARPDLSEPVTRTGSEPVTSGAALARDESAPARRRPGRQPGHIDTSVFADVIEEASRAYMLDAGYLIKMMQSAQVIQKKRNTWTIRLELREASERARAECEASNLTECRITEPCGCGPCPFRQHLDHADLVGVPSLPRNSTGRTTRPQPRPAHVPGMIYSVEAAVQPLIDLRAARTGEQQGSRVLST